MELLASEIPSWLVALIAFWFGASWGSFFNVAIYRWPLGLSVVKPPSHCPHCQARIPARWNIPIVGYLLLRGKSACCGKPVSPRYPIVEALGAVMCVAVAQRYVVGAPEGMLASRAALLALCYYTFCGGLLIATFVDLEHMEIPDEVSLPGAALGLLTAVYRDPPGVESAAIGAGGGFLLIQVLFVWSYEAVLGRRGMGEGDSKLLLMIGAFVGWQGALFALFAGAAQGLVVAVVGMLTGRRLGPSPSIAPVADADASTDTGADEQAQGPKPAGSSESAAEQLAEHAGDGGEHAGDDDDPPPTWVGHAKVPFGPFLALGALEYLFFGEELVARWIAFVSSGMRAFQ